MVCREPADARSALPADMWDHARVMRAVVMAVSVLTLSGFHVQHAQTPLLWRVLRLVPLSLFLFSVASSLGYIFISIHSAYQLMYTLSINFTNVHGLLMMFCLVHSRHDIRALVRQVAELDLSTSGCRRPGDYKMILSRAAFLVIFPVFCVIVWFVGFFSIADLKPPTYMRCWYLPPPLHSHSWYSVILALQIVSALIYAAGQLAFDVLMIGSADAVTLFQRRMELFCEKHLNYTDMRSALSKRRDQRSSN